MKEQITITRSDKNMTEEEKAFFDMVKQWGYSRFKVLTKMGVLLFGDDLGDPTACYIKLNAMLAKQDGIVTPVKVAPVVSAPVENNKPKETPIEDKPAPAKAGSNREALEEFDRMIAEKLS